MVFVYLAANKKSPSLRTGIWGKAPGDDLLSHGLSHTTIGAAAFHFRVRDGIGWFHSANFTRETVGVSPGCVFGQRTGVRCRKDGNWRQPLIGCDVASIWIAIDVCRAKGYFLRKQLEVIWSSRTDH